MIITVKYVVSNACYQTIMYEQLVCREKGNKEGFLKKNGKFQLWIVESNIKARNLR